MVNSRLFALLAVPAALALPVARPDEHSLAKCDIHFEKPVVTNPEELKSYQPTQNDDGGSTTNSSSYSFATPLPQSPSSGSSTAGTSTYQCFSNGNYPAPSTWPTFAALWSLHASAITTANSAILLVASDTSVDARLILATILQESGGRLDAPCTGTGNCGLMQGPPGSASYDGGSGDAAASIEQMIRDGVQGTPGTWPSGGPGLEYWLDVYGGDEPWKALRAYNTGSVPDAGDLSVTNGVGTESYVVDVANRLVGWDGVQRGSC
ncbi:putative exo-beta- - protein [Lasiodiplodia theobromae]|uniref:Exo-beta- - protein n=1 Tax=Lasiodiplodia theobromae TaxID=45133 RepID=A0A8H7M9X6_9PEZI|nr:putative exo-beta- - protein [Lasiodiplodia theobromae]